MKNKEYAFQKLRKLEGILKTISVMMTRPTTIEEIQDKIKESESILEDLTSVIDREPNEFN
jgi:DNA-binding FrmR family transcriptional regulator